VPAKETEGNNCDGLVGDPQMADGSEPPNHETIWRRRQMRRICIVVSNTCNYKILFATETTLGIKLMTISRSVQSISLPSGIAQPGLSFVIEVPRSSVWKLLMRKITRTETQYFGICSQAMRRML